jgi:hypothetical protein
MARSRRTDISGGSRCRSRPAAPFRYRTNPKKASASSIPRPSRSFRSKRPVVESGREQQVGGRGAPGAARPTDCAAPRPPASGADVLEEIRGRDAFSTFSQAIEATDLKQTLAGDGPFTAVEDLMMQENHEALETLLKHHVVQGERMASTAIPQRIDPMEGSEISATISEGELILNGGESDQGARVIGYIPAGNGVVHVIDSVLMTEDARDLLDEQPRG